MKTAKQCSFVLCAVAVLGCTRESQVSTSEPPAKDVEVAAVEGLAKRERELYSAAFREAVFANPASDLNGVIFLSIDGQDPPAELVGTIFLPRSRSEMGALEEDESPLERVFDKVTGQPGTRVDVKIVEWIDDDHVSVAVDAFTDGLWGGGYTATFELVDGQWVVVEITDSFVS